MTGVLTGGLSLSVAQCRLRKIGSQGLWGLWPTLADTHRQCYGFNPRRPPHLTAYKSMTYSANSQKITF